MNELMFPYNKLISHGQYLYKQFFIIVDQYQTNTRSVNMTKPKNKMVALKKSSFVKECVFCKMKTEYSGVCINCKKINPIKACMICNKKINHSKVCTLCHRKTYESNYSNKHEYSYNKNQTLTLLILPNEMLLHIINFLPLEFKWCLSQTCKSLKELILNSIPLPRQNWEQLHIRYFKSRYIFSLKCKYGVYAKDSVLLRLAKRRDWDYGADSHKTEEDLKNHRNIMNKKSYEVFSHEMNNLFCLKCFLTSCAQFNWIEYSDSHDIDWNWTETNKILSTRLDNETEKQNKLHPYLTLVSLNNHKTFQQCIITGPANSPYEAGKFLVHIEVPIDYPFENIKLKFLTKIYHPNVNDHGEISWEYNNFPSVCFTIERIMILLEELLYFPMPTYANNKEAGFLHKYHRKKYNQVAKKWTLLFSEKIYTIMPTYWEGKPLGVHSYS